jgi:triphosphoribosyl-dephospho-CoA synthase
MSLSAAIVHVHLQTLHAFPDSLIARKCGIDEAREASRRAGEVLAAGPHQSDAYQRALQALDHYLRDDQHRRNPGTTADMLAAGLFTLLRDGIITDAQGFTTSVQHADPLPLKTEINNA